MLTGSKCSKSPDPATNRGSRFTKYENIVALVTRYLSTTLTPLSSLKRIHGQTQDCCWTSVHKSWNFAPCPENSISAPTHQGSDRHLPKSLDPHGHRSILVGNDGNVQRATCIRATWASAPPEKKNLANMRTNPAPRKLFFFDVLAKHFWRGASKSCNAAPEAGTNIGQNSGRRLTNHGASSALPMFNEVGCLMSFCESGEVGKLIRSVELSLLLLLRLGRVRVLA